MNLKLTLMALASMAGFLSATEIPEVRNQWSVDLRYFGLTYHPGGGNDTEENQYPRALDKDGYFVSQIGAEAEVDYHFNPYFAVRAVSATFKDCIDVWSGHLAVGPVVGLPLPHNFNLRFGVGPSLIWRQSWFKSEMVKSWYHGDGFYGRKNDGSNYQTAFLWYGGNFDLSWRVNKNWGVVYSVIPGWPQVISNSVGARYWF